jgi:predicted outer membrane protein/sporulation protein YlmC with PRC-barrel domain
MRTTLLLASLVASTALAAPAMAQTPPAQPAQTAQPQAPANISAADFVNRAAIGNMFEIQTSQLAVNRTQNDRIRQFAQRMVDEHTKAGEALKTAATGQTLPQSLDQSHAGLLQTLQGASGPDFDRRYVRQQVNAHQESVQLYETFARTGDNPQLKTFAQQTLPTLQQHLKAAQELRQVLPPDQVGANQPGGAQARAEGSRIMVQQSAPQVRVDQAAPQVMVQQPQPNVTVNQAQPQITVRQPQPTVTVDIPQPEIIVRMPQPDVNVAMAQPQIQVRQPQPQVQVMQPQQPPQVQVQRDQAQVTVRPVEGQPNVQIVREAGQPEVRYERAEPRVVVNQAQGQPNVRFERTEGQQQPQAQQQAQGQPPAQGDPNQARVLRERINAGDVEATGAVNAANVQTRPVAVRQLEDMDVYNARGESLGEVDRVVVDGQNRQFIVIGSGGFLGLGRDHVAFPLERFWMRGDRLVIRGVSEQDIEAMDDYRTRFDSMRRLSANDQANLRLFQ